MAIIYKKANWADYKLISKKGMSAISFLQGKNFKCYSVPKNPSNYKENERDRTR